MANKAFLKNENGMVLYIHLIILFWNIFPEVFIGLIDVTPASLFRKLCHFMIKMQRTRKPVLVLGFVKYFSYILQNFYQILQNHRAVMLTFGISLPEEDIDLPKLYWIPKLHKNPYKQRYIAGSAKCSTKKGKRKVQGVPQSQTAALPRTQEEEKTDKSKKAQTEQTYEKH